MYKVVIDPSLCSGFGSCVELVPDAFELGDDGIARARVAETDDSAVLEAADACPMGAIVVRESEAA